MNTAIFLVAVHGSPRSITVNFDKAIEVDASGGIELEKFTWSVNCRHRNKVRAKPVNSEEKEE